MRDRAFALRSEAVGLELDGNIEVTLESGPHTVRPDDAKARAQLITAIRGGQHAELAVKATTFRQKAGHPNLKFLRHADSWLPSLAASYVRQPFILDHNTREQASRMGTITSSELHNHGGTGWASFKMGLQVVKPDGVISVLDGTIDRFSIGWNRGAGAVNCSVHGVDVMSRDSCGCWPGDTVMLDGKPNVVEFEFQSAKGTELSAIIVPAVEDGTGIQEVRTALADELGLAIVPVAKETTMLTRLATALGLSALTAAEEDRAVITIEELRRGRLAAEQERDTARTELERLKTELATVKTTGLKSAIDAVLNSSGYATGRLVYGRDSEGKALADNFEPMLRQLAETQGIDKLQATLATMPVRVPVRQNQLATTTEPPPTIFPGALADDQPIALVQVHSPRLNKAVALTPELASMARQMKLDPADVLDQVERDLAAQEAH